MRANKSLSIHSSKNLAWAFLPVLLLLVAAMPMYDVHIQLEPDVRILTTDEVIGEHTQGLYGSWKLLALTDQGAVIAETPFDPYVIGNDLEPVLLESTWVSIPAPVALQTLQVIDDTGRVATTWNKPQTCGDGICQPAEGISCVADCGLHEEIVRAQEELQTPAQTGIAGWKLWVIVGCVLLIVVLILVLMHVNRKKPNPLQMDTLN